jgi:hypothetical protein
VAKQCAVLFVNPDRRQSAHPAYLREVGFRIDEVHEWPDDDRMLREYHVILILVRAIDGAPMLAARLRAKPYFDRRLLIALVGRDTPLPERRTAEASGFDDVVNDSGDARELTTRILRGLRARPELRCALPPFLNRRRRAA